MELYQIRYYCALCDTLHFGRAAEKCGVSQPTLTRAVQRLEQELNGLLMRRERGSTHLTDTRRSQCVNQSANATRRCSKSAFTTSVRRP